MKRLIFVLFVLLQSGYLVNAQNDRTFYAACFSKAQLYVDFMKSQLTVKTFTNDSIEFKSGSTPYKAKKVTNFNFMKSVIGEDEKYPNPFYLYKVDDNSFIIHSLSIKDPLNAGFTYYHTDKNKEFETDENKRCAADELNRFTSLIKSYQDTDLVVESAKAEEVYNAKQKELNAQTKSVVTEYMKTYKTKRVDPTLEKAIRQQWNAENDGVTNPLLRIYFMDPNYSFFRNEFGIIMRKTVTTSIVYKWKKTGLCYMQWRWYGYESLGGGAFNDEIKYWTGDSYLTNFPENRKIIAGTNYEVDCAAFQK